MSSSGGTVEFDRDTQTNSTRARKGIHRCRSGERSGHFSGDVAQLGEHRLCKPGVRGSSPLISTGWFVRLRNGPSCLRFVWRWLPFAWHWSPQRPHGRPATNGLMMAAAQYSPAHFSCNAGWRPAMGHFLPGLAICCRSLPEVAGRGQQRRATGPLVESRDAASSTSGGELWRRQCHTTHWHGGLEKKGGFDKKKVCERPKGGCSGIRSPYNSGLPVNGSCGPAGCQLLSSETGTFGSNDL